MPRWSGAPADDPSVPLLATIDRNKRRRHVARSVVATIVVTGCALATLNRGEHYKVFKTPRHSSFAHDGGGAASTRPDTFMRGPQPTMRPTVMPPPAVPYQLPWAPYDIVDLPPPGTKGSPFFGGSPFHFAARNLSDAVGLCSEFDDDGIFPNSECGCADLHAECEGLMPLHARYYELCFEDACGNSATNLAALEPGQGDTCDEAPRRFGPSWGNPCAWQIVRSLPAACAGDFAPEAPFNLHSRNRPNAFPELTHDQREVLGLTENFLGSCNVHSFCLICLDDTYATGVNPYCAAVYETYGGTPTASTFFEDLDTFWCHPHVLASLQRRAGGEI